MLERRDIATKAELANRGAQAAQSRVQSVPVAPGATPANSADSGPVPSTSGNSALTADAAPGNQLPIVNTATQGGNVPQAQSAGHDAGSNTGQEGDRGQSVEGASGPGPDPSQPANGGQNESQLGLRRSVGTGWPSPGAAFEAAKDIMEALRGKHANLATELEVQIHDLTGICKAGK